MTKISFLFLIKDIIDNEESWNLFFKNVSPDKYNIYIHYKNNVRLHYFDKYKLKRCIDTCWGERSLVDAQNLLLKEGLKDNKTTHFIILSGSCIPLKNFDYIYEYLNPNYSYFERKSPDLKQLKSIVYNFLTKTEIKKSSQWCILNRKHSIFLCDNETIIKYFENNCYPDERVYVTALDKFNMGHEIINGMTTYCNWDLKKAHPIDFKIIQSHFLNYLLESKHLFARKFTNCFVKYKRQKININDFQLYKDFISSNNKDNINNLNEVNIMKTIGFDGISCEYDEILNKNKGNLLHSIQTILEEEEKKYKNLYSCTNY